MAKTPATGNMRFYAQVQDTPAEAQKTFNNGRFSGTDINPMWRIKMLTQLFGPAGIGWWTENETYTLEECPATNEVAVFCTLSLYYKDPETGAVSHPVTGVGGNKFVSTLRSGAYCNDEAFKMAYTDALSIACKALGFSADIYYARDRTKYVMEEAPSPELDALRKQADTVMKAYSKGFDTEKKMALAEQIKAITGGIANYMRVDNPEALKKLIETFADKKEEE